MRQEGLRDFLSKQKLIEKVIDIAQDLTDPDKEYDALDVQRMRTAAELNLKLASKFLPDLKSTELTGPRWRFSHSCTAQAIRWRRLNM
jgi:hypothetical protein